MLQDQTKWKKYKTKTALVGGSDCCRKLLHFATLLSQLPVCFPLSALRAHLLRSSWEGDILLGQIIIQGPKLTATENVNGKGLSRFQFDLIVYKAVCLILLLIIWMLTSVCFSSQNLVGDLKCPQSLLLSNLACLKARGLLKWLEPRMDLQGSKHLALVLQSNRKFQDMKGQIEICRLGKDCRRKGHPIPVSIYLSYKQARILPNDIIYSTPLQIHQQRGAAGFPGVMFYRLKILSFIYKPQRGYLISRS